MASVAERVQFRRYRRLREGTVYVGRNRHGLGAWGNPFAVGRPHPFQPELGLITDRAQAVDLYAAWLPTQPDLCARAVEVLPGRDLACWCPLDGGPCHGDILLALANTRMWALTEQQPWAWAIAYAGKDVENRTWAPPRAAVGQTLLIHGGRRWSPGWQDNWLLHQAWAAFAAARGGEPGQPGQLGQLGPGSAWCAEGIVAVATLAGAHVAANGCCPKWGQPGFHDPARGWVDMRHWELRDVTPLPEPIPGGGRQMLWNPPPTARATVIGATR